MLSFVDPSYVNEVQKSVPITSQKRQDLYKLTETKERLSLIIIVIFYNAIVIY